MSVPLGSRTSGVDGSSEGGRINTIRLDQVLVLYALPLLAEIRGRGHRGKVDVQPAHEDGIWILKLIFDGEPPADVPPVWHGHRVVVATAAQPA